MGFLSNVRTGTFEARTPSLRGLSSFSYRTLHITLIVVKDIFGLDSFFTVDAGIRLGLYSGGKRFRIVITTKLGNIFFTKNTYVFTATHTAAYALNKRVSHRS